MVRERILRVRLNDDEFMLSLIASQNALLIYVYLNVNMAEKYLQFISRLHLYMNLSLNLNDFVL